MRWREVGVEHVSNNRGLREGSINLLSVQRATILYFGMGTCDELEALLADVGDHLSGLLPGHVPSGGG
ncbi:hypothetical protein MTBLM1_130028 [Rhodospirillaceae bacterium LM-1]|nr:hypothetical protein MTBLM1_130028 [Rhodospirillaceae bacterium LM-1]